MVEIGRDPAHAPGRLDRGVVAPAVVSREAPVDERRPARERRARAAAGQGNGSHRVIDLAGGTQCGQICLLEIHRLEAEPTFEGRCGGVRLRPRQRALFAATPRRARGETRRLVRRGDRRASWAARRPCPPARPGRRSDGRAPASTPGTAAPESPRSPPVPRAPQDREAGRVAPSTDQDETHGAHPVAPGPPRPLARLRG